MIHGFTAVRRGKIPRLGADTVLFRHGVSGAELFYICNSDEELGFSVVYRTPSLDETDANHVLEHAIVTSSGKYSGRDVFFEAANKSYNTFVNAYTYPVMTCYPVCSQSERQLVRLIDVYLSCMTDPDFLREPNIFRREGVRYELRDRRAPIHLAGTVYGEDFGYLTDTGSEAQRNMLHLLYPGQNAANCVGRAHRNYAGLTWERVKTVYDSFYTFDNALLLLYGNCQGYEDTLEFLDREYLNNSAAGGLSRGGAGSAREWFHESAGSGYAEETFPSPAYEGDSSDHASIVELGFDVSGLSAEERFQLDLITDMLDHENSPFHHRLRAEGIHNRAYCDLAEDCPKAYFTMGIDDAGEEQKDAFRRAVEATLEEVAARGIDREIVGAVVKDRELAALLTRETSSLGAEVSSAIGLYWALTGETDYYEQRDRAFSAVKNDEDQYVLKGLAQKLRAAKRKALAVTVPSPGLAEQLEEELERELARKKAAMSDAELDELIRQTAEFDLWNKKEDARGGFAISSKELRPSLAPADYSRRQHGCLVSVSAPAETEGAVYCKVMFDTAAVKEEDLHFLSLSTMLLLDLPTERYSVEEQKIKEIRYLNQLSLDFAYPDEHAADGHRPMLTARWFGLAEDFETSLDFLIEILSHTKFDDSGEILRLIDKYKYDYDLSRCGDGLEVALDFAGGAVDFYQRYRNYMEGQDFYRFLCELAADMWDERKEATSAGGVLPKADSVKAGLQRAAAALRRGQRIFALTAAAAADLPELEAALRQKLAETGDGLRQRLARLEDGESIPVSYGCLEKLPARRTGICIEASDQCSVRLASFAGRPEFRGRYLPFLMAASDRFLVPRLRFEGGAYGAGAAFRLTLGEIYIYSSGDPNVGSTLDAFDQVWERLRDMKIDAEELDGYILSAFAAAERPRGPLGNAMNTLDCAVEGVDLAEAERIAADIRRAAPTDQAAAAECLATLFRDGYTVTIGNGSRLAEEAERFEELLDYKE